MAPIPKHLAGIPQLSNADYQLLVSPVEPSPADQERMAQRIRKITARIRKRVPRRVDRPEPVEIPTNVSIHADQHRRAGVRRAY